MAKTTSLIWRECENIFYAPGVEHSWYYVDLVPDQNKLTPAQRTAGEIYEVEKVLADGTFRALSTKPLTRVAAQARAVADYKEAGAVRTR